MPDSHSTPVDNAYRFDVALSFAGDNKRDKVREVAKILEKTLGKGRVFFDEFFEAEIAGQDADTYLQNIYLNESHLVVSCVCKRYNEKQWTQDEWRAIRAFERDKCRTNESRNRFLPLRFGDGEVDGVFSNAIVPDVRDRDSVEIAQLIIDRLSKLAAFHPVTSNGPIVVETVPLFKTKWFRAVVFVLLCLLGIGAYKFWWVDDTPQIDSLAGNEFIEKYFTAQASSELKSFSSRLASDCRIRNDEEQQLRVILPEPRPANPTQKVSGVIQSSDGSKSSPIKIEFEEAIDFLETEWIDISGLVSLDEERIPLVTNAKLHNRRTKIDGCKMLENLRETDRYIEKLYIKDGQAQEPYTWVCWKCRVLWNDPSSRNLLSFVSPIAKTGADCFIPEGNKPGPMICKVLDETSRQKLKDGDIFEIEGRVVSWDGVNITLDKVELILNSNN